MIGTEELKDVLALAIKRVETGKSSLERIFKEKICDKSMAFLIPKGDEEALLILEKNNSELINKYKLSNIHVIINKENSDCKKCNQIIVSDKELEAILDLCRVYDLSTKIIVVSLNKPYGRSIDNLIGIHDFDKEKLVKSAILNI